VTREDVDGVVLEVEEVLEERHAGVR
jgi:hypothetical protein